MDVGDSETAIVMVGAEMVGAERGRAGNKEQSDHLQKKSYLAIIYHIINAVHEQ